ncbi:hypothetical protein CVT24_008170 [Panaeolus cyanescens]|uniref:Beta-glucuronidase C-terminal domain-containing protein n=1 Tax=Panaeolus cyanescens TaxID=181874 RepID=A0A409VFJ9_9AGAR|nr:hypothetical protein CVT24_008170 [Panaeolus cyanescens]
MTKLSSHGLGTVSLPSFFLTFIVFVASIQRCSASITVYHTLGFDNPVPTAATTGPAGTYTGAAAYNPTTLAAPTPPGPDALPTSFPVPLAPAVPAGASIQQRGSFFGFSIEMSVVNQVLGRNSSFLQVPFLNLMANLQSRSGRIDIRVGGNTQETAVLVESTPDGKILEKDISGASGPTQTPPLDFTPELIKMLRSISSLVNVRWHLGIPFNDTSNLRLQIAETGQQILGDYLIGLQVGNEPDLYAAHQHRQPSYGPEDYFGEFGVVVQAVNADTNIPKKNLLIGPNLSGTWTPEMIWDTGFIDQYSDSLGALAVEHYPNDNCFAQFGVGKQQDPQALFPTYLTHGAGQALAAPYLDSTALAQTKGKEFLMFETNTASCGGFVGISDSFAAALWGLDYGMQLAYSNFSGALFHVGGQNVFYNPFTPPPTNQSTFRQWSIGPIYYSALVMHETLGATNTSQVLDLQANGANQFTPGYAIYEHGQLARVLLINFVSDSSGASDVTAGLTIPSGGPTPSQVNVKYLSASSVSQKGNFTWANQTFGDNFQSDGRLMGVESIATAPCAPATDGNGSTICNIKVPAPAAALVFFTDLTETAAAPSATFATTAQTRLHNTVGISSASLAASNGHWWASNQNFMDLSSTSQGSIQIGEARKRTTLSAVGAAVGLAAALLAGWGMLGQTPIGTGTSTASGSAASYTGAAAYNPTTLIAPAPPGPSGMPTNFQIPLSPAAPPGVSIPQRGSFFGFSIEMSVVNQVLGKNASFLQVPFLNLMANLQSRSGRIDIRVGGNTQETAVLVDSTPDGKILEKDLQGVSNPTQTPPLLFTPELLYMLRNISSLVNVRWHLGIPFNDTTNLRLGIAEKGQQILGDYLIGLQVGNEPDLYAAHGHRPQTYGPFDYFGEFGVLVDAVTADPNIPKKNLLIGPNVNSGAWSPEMVWDTGFIDSYTDNLAFLAVEHYPTDNCFAQFGVGTQREPQDVFPTFLNHTAGQSVIGQYLASTALAQTKGKEFLMFETNTASCGGFPGVSDSFGAALWALDYAMEMAHSNFSGALFHIGGQNVFYNPFTPPPTNQSTFRQWTIGPIYYSALVMAEALGGTNTTQVIDVQANGNNIFSPAYAIYEHGQLARALVINFVSDNSGASDLTVGLTIPAGGPTPSQVKVKYLAAASVSQKGNITWAGQTFGVNFQSDGRLMGTEDIQTAPCAPATDGSGSTVCDVHVPAPAAALVFFSDLTETAAAPAETFATTAQTRLHNTASIDPSVLATSNGHWVSKEGLSSTSEGSISAAREARDRMWKSAGGAVVVLFVAVVAGWGVVMA